ncbi:MAG: protein kinase [Sandaracinaceae bacterium]
MRTSEAPAPEDDAFVGTVIEGRFKVLERIAAGGMGVVYKAEQVPLGRSVAIKILEQTKVDDGTFSRRFFLEASAVAKLAHPNTVVVHDYGRTDEGVFYLAMEYLEGRTLQDHLAENGPLTPQDAVHVGLQVCSSLRDAHQQGLVHRDLKPGNVMFVPRGGDPLFVKVLAFGLVKVVSGDEKADLGLTRSGVMMGSPHYMSPEQVKAGSLDHRTDIYSFGATFHHVLAGAPPFPVGSPFEAMTAHVYSPAPRLRDTWPSCAASERLEELVLRCLEKDPAARPQSMDELMTALRGCQAEAGWQPGSGAYPPPSGAMPAYASGVRGGTGPQAASAMTPPAGMPAPSDPGSHPSHGHVHPSGTTGPGGHPVPKKTMKWSGATPGSGPQGGAAGTGPYPGSGPQVGAGPYAGAASQAGSGPYAGAGPQVGSGPYAGSGPQVGSGPQAPHPAFGSGPQAPAPGSSRVPMMLAVGALVAVGAVAAALALFLPLGGEQAEATPTPAEVPAPPPPAPPVDPTPADVEPPPPVVVQTDPEGARVVHDGTDLGDTPVRLPIPAGESWTVSLHLPEHQTRTVTVAAGQDELTVHLRAAPSATPPRPVRPPRPRPPRPATPPSEEPTSTATPERPPERPPADPHLGEPGLRPDHQAPDLTNPWANER